MDDLRSLNDLRGMEGLSKNAHLDLEQIVRNLDKLGSPCFTQAQEEADYENT